MQNIMQHWRKEIEQDPHYAEVVAKTKPGQKKRQEKLAAAIDPFEEAVAKDIEAKGLGKQALVDHLGDEVAALRRAYAFGASFVLSVEVPGFEALSEERQEVLHYQHAIKGIVWESLVRYLMAPERALS